AGSIIETPDKGYVVAGSSNTTITSGIFLMKLDPVGKKTWTHIFKKGEYYHGSYISTTRDGGFIIAGSVYRNDTQPSSLWDVYILKTDSGGRELWTGFFTGEKNDFVTYICQTEDGGYIIAGTTESYGGTGGPSTFLLKMNEFGNREWFTTYETGMGSERPSVIQTQDGGYILMGTSLPGTTNLQQLDLFLIRTDDSGKELWGKKVSGVGKNSGNLLIQDSEGITVIAGSDRGAVQGKIIILNIDLYGNEQRNRTFNIGQTMDIQDIAVSPNEGYFVAGLSTDEVNLQKNRLTIIKVLDTPFHNGGIVKNSFDLTVKIKDAQTGTFIGGANMYIDGQSVGSTSEPDGKQILRDREKGIHTIRVAKTGYKESTRAINLSQDMQISFTLNRSNVIPLQIKGPTDEKIDIIFVASNTSYNCNTKTKILDNKYPSDEQKFITDVKDTIDNVYLKLDTRTSEFVGLPYDFQQRFNFYYYWDPENFADAFDGCAGKLPDKFWDNAPFADAAVIMYPSYRGLYSGSPCEPIGCANGLGAGSSSWMKAPADSPMILLHESGHVVFGLIDTYCGDTYYIENSPFPNVWDTLEECIKDAEKEHWSASECRQILKSASRKSDTSCVKNFWKADADPDIMGGGAYSGRFGNASTTRICYILDTINRWQK
ncbi:MAG: carboxypeptidase-like regulatory domain-containing protein, partial [Methanoregula sp.]